MKAVEYPSWLKAADNNRAQYAIQCLNFFALTGLVPGIGVLLEEHSREHMQLLLKRYAALKHVEQCMDIYKSSMLAGVPPDDLSLTHSFAVLCSILGLCFHQAGQSTLADKYAVLHERLLVDFLKKCESQTQAICTFVRTIRTHLDSLSGKPQRIVLVEMPSGNSLITKLLHHALQPSYTVEIVVAALSRTNLKRLGISRKDLLREQLQKLEFKSDDIVVYADEWASGANFKTITEFLSSLLPTGVFFLPAACLSCRSQSGERFESFCKKHDALIQKYWGIDGSHFRAFIPKLNSRNTQLLFFWSENDRMAGYRKMQIHGSMFSILDQILDDLRSDKEQLQVAASIFVATRADHFHRHMPTTVEHFVTWIIVSYDKWHDDYLQIRADLRNCAEEMGRGGVVDEFDLDLLSPGSKYQELIGNRDAGLAWMIALSFMNRLWPGDPVDRYYFHDEAPSLVPLKDYAALQHTIIMELLCKQYDGYDFSAFRQSYGNINVRPASESD